MNIRLEKPDDYREVEKAGLAARPAASVLLELQ